MTDAGDQGGNVDRTPPLRIAVIGSRGIPPNYGGFETFCWELGQRMADRGHQLTVIGRRRWVGPTRKLRRGLTAQNVPSLPGKYLETVSAAAFSAAVVGRCDCMLFLNAATAFAIPLARLRHPRVPVLINVDGLEWQRAKWGFLGRTWYRVGEWFSLHAASGIVADADVIAEHYRARRPDVKMWTIAYGSSLVREPRPDLLAKHDLVHEGYLLYVSRFEPENNPELVARAYLASRAKLPLVMLGAAAYDSQLQRRMEELAADSRLRLLGGVYGDEYRALQSSAAAYIQGTQVGGTHPALVEAMSVGNLVLAFDTPENREVLADTGLHFSSQSELTSLIDRVGRDLSREDWGERARQRVDEHYTWEAVTDAYESMFRQVTRGGRGA